MSDPRRTDPTGASISVIEEPIFEDLWKYLTQNVQVPHFGEEKSQTEEDASLYDIRVMLFAIMGCQDLPWMKVPIGLSVLPESLNGITTGVRNQGLFDTD